MSLSSLSQSFNRGPCSCDSHVLLLRGISCSWLWASSQEPLVTHPRTQPLTSEWVHYLQKWHNLPIAYSEAGHSWERKKSWAEFPTTKASSWIHLPGSRNSDGGISVATLKGQISSSATDNMWAQGKLTQQQGTWFVLVFCFSKPDLGLLHTGQSH